MKNCWVSYEVQYIGFRAQSIVREVVIFNLGLLCKYIAYLRSSVKLKILVKLFRPNQRHSSDGFLMQQPKSPEIPRGWGSWIQMTVA